MTPEDAALLEATAEVREAGNALLGQIADAGAGWFARDRAQSFILVGLGRPSRVQGAQHVHKKICSMLAEQAYLSLQRTAELCEALQRASDARDALWDLLVVWDAVERLGGGLTPQSELDALACQIKSDVRSAAAAARKGAK